MSDSKKQAGNNRDAQRYYWLRLQVGFFNSKEIRVIQQQPNGAEYIILWLKLLLQSIDDQHPGLLRFHKNIPYTAKLIATVTDTNIDIVKGAVQVFEMLGMVKRLENGDYWIDCAKHMTGSETYGALRQRLYRDGQKKLPAPGEKPTNVTLSQACPREIEKEKEIDKEPDFSLSLLNSKLRGEKIAEHMEAELAEIAQRYGFGYLLYLAALEDNAGYFITAARKGKHIDSYRADNPPTKPCGNCGLPYSGTVCTACGHEE